MRVLPASARIPEHIHTHSSVHLDCVAVTVGPWVCSLSGSAWVRARVQCTMVWALHHSASWLDRPWLWGPSRSCWVHSNCALLRKGFCILLMDNSPTSPVWVDSFDWQTHTGMQTCAHAWSRGYTTFRDVYVWSNLHSHQMQAKQCSQFFFVKQIFLTVS